jgi:hypothetical protein
MKVYIEYQSGASSERFAHNFKDAFQMLSTLIQIDGELKEATIESMGTLVGVFSFDGIKEWISSTTNK